MDHISGGKQFGIIYLGIIFLYRKNLAFESGVCKVFISAAVYVTSGSITDSESCGQIGLKWKYAEAEIWVDWNKCNIHIHKLKAVQQRETQQNEENRMLGRNEDSFMEQNFRT